MKVKNVMIQNDSARTERGRRTLSLKVKFFIVFLFFPLCLTGFMIASYMRDKAFFTQQLEQSVHIEFENTERLLSMYFANTVNIIRTFAASELITAEEADITSYKDKHTASGVSQMICTPCSYEARFLQLVMQFQL